MLAQSGYLTGNREQIAFIVFDVLAKVSLATPLSSKLRELHSMETHTSALAGPVQHVIKSLFHDIRVPLHALSLGIAELQHNRVVSRNTELAQTVHLQRPGHRAAESSVGFRRSTRCSA